jgi:DNA-directed RNA polymerase beta' subunit
VTQTAVEDEDRNITVADTVVLVEQGELLTGILDKNTLGASNGSLIHIIQNEHGPQATKTFLNSCQRLVNYWMLHHGYTIGLGDTIADFVVVRHIAQVIDRAKLEVQGLIETCRKGAMKAKPGMSLLETLEMKVNETLNRAREKSGMIVQDNLTERNNIVTMVLGGSKGNETNLSQIIATVGQQNVMGRRIPFGFVRRTLPHFAKYDYGPESRGFVANSYLQGLTPQEFFFHAMGGREGLVDTAVKSVTGDTAVFVSDGRTVQRVQIGPYIDELMSAADPAVIEREQKMNFHKLNVANLWMATADEKGVSSWSPLTAVTRHDPGEVLYRIDTRSGRSVTVSASKSMLFFDTASRALREVQPDKLRVGDLVPVLAHLAAPPALEGGAVWRVAAYVPASEAVAAADRLAESFAFSRENGFFFGVFLAEGVADEAVGVVRISTRSSTVVTRVRAWMDSFGIAHETEVKPDCAWLNTLHCRSRTLARFFGRAFGTSGATKRIPKEFFTAPLPFLDGLLDGFLRGNNRSMHAEVQFEAKSRELIDGFMLICNLRGAFGTVESFEAPANHFRPNPVTAYTLRFNSQWMRPFEGLSLLDRNEGESEESEDVSQLFSQMGDVVLDPISRITPVTPYEGQQLYDVTVPATLNFALANGLVIRDTAETGYIQRRLVKALEDVMVKYDGTLRNSLGEVIAFLYGEDGMDATFLESQQLQTLRLSDEQMRHRYLFETDDRALERANLRKDIVEDLRKGESDVLLQEYEQLLEDRATLRKIIRSGDTDIILPVNVTRLIWNSKKLFNVDARRPSDLHPYHVIESLHRLESTLVVVFGSDEISKDAQKNATLLLMIHLRSMLSSKEVVLKHRLSAAAFNWLTGEVEKLFFRSLAQPGEMAGTIAAQSMGEPATQMTLNTFHSAGVSSKNVTLGVPRLKEIINVANTKYPTMTVMLEPSYARDEEAAQMLQSRLEYTTLRKVVKNTAIYFDPNPTETVVLEDQRLVEDFFAYEAAEAEQDWSRFSPWVLRMVFDKRRMLDKRLELSQVAEKIGMVWPGECQCIFTPDLTSDELVLRLRFTRSSAKEAGGDVRLKAIESALLTKLPLSGIAGVEKVMRDQKKTQLLGFATFNEATGAFDNAAEEWFFETDGSNLLATMSLPGVDAKRTICNDIKV